jgi:quercetin dioxygenase-like cupin family protein
MTDSTRRDDLGQLLVATSTDIESLPWQQQEGQPGLQYKVLWRSGDVVLGVMELAEGSANTEHTHHGAHHHIMVLAGSCTMVGKKLDVGSYIYIPPGVAHGVSDVGEGGCRLFYTYRPVEVSPAPVVEPDIGAPV